MACDQVSKGSFDTASNARVGATTTATTTTTTSTTTIFTATDSAITPACLGPVNWAILGWEILNRMISWALLGDNNLAYI